MNGSNIILNGLILDLKDNLKDIQQITDSQNKKDTYYFNDYKSLSVPNPIENLQQQIITREKYELIIKKLFQTLSHNLFVMNQNQFKLKKLNYDYPIVQSWINQGYEFNDQNFSYQQIAQNFDSMNRFTLDNPILYFTRDHALHLQILSKYPEILIIYGEKMTYVQRLAVFSSYIQYLELLIVDQSFGTIYETQLVLPPNSYLQSPFTKLIFTAVLKYLTTSQDVMRFPGFYIQRNNSSLYTFFDLLQSIIQEKSVASWIKQTIAPLVLELSTITSQKIYSRKFIENNYQKQFIFHNIEQFIAKIYILLNNIPEIILNLFSIVKFTLKIFFDNIFQSLQNNSALSIIIKKKYSYLATKTSDQCLHETLKNFKFIFIFGVIIRNVVVQPYYYNVFHQKQTDVTLQNLVFLIDLILEIGYQPGPFSIQPAEDENVQLYMQLANQPKIQAIIEQFTSKIHIPDDDFDFLQQFLSQESEFTESKITGNIWLISSNLAETIDQIRLVNSEFIRNQLQKLQNFTSEILLKLPKQHGFQFQSLNIYQYTKQIIKTLFSIPPGGKLSENQILFVQFGNDLQQEADSQISDKLYCLKEQFNVISQEYNHAVSANIEGVKLNFKSPELNLYQSTCQKLISIFEVESQIQNQIQIIETLNIEDEEEFAGVFLELQSDCKRVIQNSCDCLNKLVDFQDILDADRYQNGLIVRLGQILQNMLDFQEEQVQYELVEIDEEVLQDTLFSLNQQEADEQGFQEAVGFFNQNVIAKNKIIDKQFVPQNIFEMLFSSRDPSYRDFKSIILESLYQ